MICIIHASSILLIHIIPFIQIELNLNQNLDGKYIPEW